MNEVLVDAATLRGCRRALAACFRHAAWRRCLVGLAALATLVAFERWLVVLIGVVFGLLWLRMGWRAMNAALMLTPGARMSAEMRDDCIRFTGPFGCNEMVYREIRGVSRHGALLQIDHSLGGHCHHLGGLLTDAELEEVRRRADAAPRVLGAEPGAHLAVVTQAEHDLVAQAFLRGRVRVERVHLAYAAMGACIVALASGRDVPWSLALLLVPLAALAMVRLAWLRRAARRRTELYFPVGRAVRLRIEEAGAVLLLDTEPERDRMEHRWVIDVTEHSGVVYVTHATPGVTVCEVLAANWLDDASRAFLRLPHSSPLAG